MHESSFNPTMVTFGGQDRNIYTEVSVKTRWEQLANQVQAILKEFSVPTPESLQGIETRYIQFLRDEGIITDTLPKPVVFILAEDIPAIDAKLNPIGSAVVPDSLGFSSILYGNVVILEEGFSDLSKTYALAEEIFHSLGEQVIAYSPTSSAYSRRGFDLSGENKKCYGWFLEEAISKYYPYLFLKQLESEGLLPTDFARLHKKIEYFENKNRYRNGKVFFTDERLYADPYHLFLIERTTDGTARDVLGLKTPDAVAADIFTDLITSLDSSDQKSLLATLRRARQDHRHILEAAKLIDAYFGKGTYVTLMRCQPTFEDVFRVREQLLSHIN